jgi:hypothetical protein
MAIGLTGVCIDVYDIRRETPGEEIAHVAAYAAMILQWLV